MEKSPKRIKILEKIDEYERNGWFDRDVEEDPPSKVLMPENVDYLNKKLSSKIKTFFANLVARAYFDRQIRIGNLIIDEVNGLDNIINYPKGAMLTCNHFNAFDNYALFKSMDKHLRKRTLYKVIREGNYTAFPGLYGFFFKNCNTIPLSSNRKTIMLMLNSVDVLLKRGEKILIYPEQGMWWNYKKPRPLKTGAFSMAVRSNVPIIPCFITMSDSDKLDKDGFYIQKYAIHILKPIFPKPELSIPENAQYLCDENFRVWKELYEKVYGIPLTYLSKEE